MRRSWASTIHLACQCVLAVLAITFSFSSNVYHVGLQNGILGIAAIMLCCHARSPFEQLDARDERSVAVLAAIYAALWVIGKTTANFEGTMGADHTKAWLVAVFAGMYYLFRSAIVLAARALGRRQAFGDREGFDPRTACLIVTCISAAYLVFYYPGVTFHDGMRQLHCWLGDTEFTNHDPAFATMLIGVCATVGRALVSDNFGMFLYSLLLLVTSSILFWRAFVLMRDFDTPAFLNNAGLVYWCALPIIHFYLLTMCKDTPFALAVMALAIVLVEMRRRSISGEERTVDIARMFVCLLLICLLRNDGVWIALFVLGCALIAWRNLRPMAVAGAAAVIMLHVCYGALLLPALNITPGSPREALSVPLQQIARWAVECPGTFSEADQAAYDQVFTIPADEFAAKYNPNISDNVKKWFVANPTYDDWRAFATLWSSGLSAHPTVYARAYLDGYYGYLYPDRLGDEAGFQGFDVEPQYQYDMDYRQPEWAQPTRSLIGGVVDQWRKQPIVSWLYCPGFYAWALFACIAAATRSRKLADLVPFSPFVAILIIALLSPVNGRIRYILSLILCLPVIVAWACHIAQRLRN